MGLNICLHEGTLNKFREKKDNSIYVIFGLKIFGIFSLVISIFKPS